MRPKLHCVAGVLLSLVMPRSVDGLVDGLPVGDVTGRSILAGVSVLVWVLAVVTVPVAAVGVGAVLLVTLNLLLDWLLPVLVSVGVWCPPCITSVVFSALTMVSVTIMLVMTCIIGSAALV